MKTYTWKQKNLMLQVGGLLLALMSYHLAIKETLLLKDAVWGARQRAADDRALDEEWAGLRAGKKRLDELAASSDMDRQLLVHRAATASGSRVLRMPAPLRYREQGTGLLFREYGLQGSFFQLLRTLHQLERDRGLHLVHAAFRKEPDSYTRKPQLWLRITILNIEEYEHE